MRIRAVPAVTVVVVAAVMGFTACFSPSSGGPGGQASFDGGSDTSASFDSTMLEESSTDAPTEVGPGVDSGADSSVTNDAAPESGKADASDASAVDAPADALAADAGGALVRFANLVSNLGMAVDFCVAPTGSSYTTPYMFAQGVSGGLAYKDVSEYAALAPASGFDVRVVAAGSSSCATGLAADVSVGASTPASPTTVTFTGLAGDAGFPLGLTGRSDASPATSPMNASRFRAIHAAPSLGAVDFEIGVSPYTEAIQTGVTFGATFAASTVASGGPTPDANGYIEPGYGTAQVTLLISGVETTSYYVGVNGSPTASVTAFLVGAQGSVADPAGFVDCDELAAPSGHKASCPFNSAAPVTIQTRIFHGASGVGGAVDTCFGLAPASQPFSAPLAAAAGNSAGVGYLQLSGILTAIPANTDFKLGFAPVGTGCPGLGFSVSSSLQYTELTATLDDWTFSPAGYNSYFFETSGAPSATQANVSVGSLSRQQTGQQIVDVYATETGMSEVALAPMLGGFGQVGPIGETPDTYSFRVHDEGSMTDVYSKGGFTLSANETYLLLWANVGNYTSGTLAVCPLSSRAPAAVVTCPN